MKRIIKYSWLALLFAASSCYEPLEIDTAAIDNVNIPITIAMPLVDGNLNIDYDSLVNFDDLEGGFITFINNRAYIKFDTIFDFYDELSVFLGAADLDFGNTTQFKQSFDMAVDANTTTIQVIGEVDGHTVHDDAVLISPQDSFRTQYNANSVFLGIDQDAEMRIDGYDLDKELDLGLDFEIYKVEIRSGSIDFSLKADNRPNIIDDSLYVHPSFHYTDNGNDTMIVNEKAFYIASSENEFPLGLKIKLDLAISNVYTAQGDTFKHEFVISTFDTALSIDLAGTYFAGEGDNKVDVKINNWLEVDAESQKVIVPLPEKMEIDANINNLKFQQVQFNYGRDSMFSSDLDFDFDLEDIIPDDLQEQSVNDLEIEGFYLKDPNIKIKLRSNLGFPAQFAINNMQFETSTSPELMTNDGSAQLTLNQAENPNSISTLVEAKEDSMVIDSTTSRISQIDLYDVKGIHMDYVVILNPEDQGHIPGSHNFIYLYDEEDREAMYDVVLAASAEVPIAFRFNNIKLESTQSLELDSLDMDLVDLSEDDSINLKVKLWTTNFPFELATQFYFGKSQSNGGLEILDSLFNKEELLIPSSIDGIQDSAAWSVRINKSRFDAIQSMDSVKLNIRFSMDDETFYHIEKGSSLDIGYKFSIAPSTASITIE